MEKMETTTVSIEENKASREQQAKLRLKDMNSLIPLACHLYDSAQMLATKQAAAQAAEQGNNAYTVGTSSTKLKANFVPGCIFPWPMWPSPFDFEKDHGKTRYEDFQCYGPFGAIIRAAHEYQNKPYSDKLRALTQEKEHLYVEVIKMRQAVSAVLAAESADAGQCEYLQAINIILTKDYNDLQSDLGIEG